MRIGKVPRGAPSGHCAGEADVTIGGWLLTLEPGDGGRRARQSLSLSEGVECRMEAKGTLVVVTQTPPDSIDGMRETLAHAPGVLRAELVARFDDGARVACRP
jgi:hypothetical protein